nr:chromodomain-helicase-DNA-binding protein 1-like isoform X2 [Geotrypetes seraphini]XP_033796301.1 chromodomain-helicase-DNA-binding protein 1-like isoform X2 [Geotrypetes seraphini]XP_033796302.1 chromodomain-helicase-DNA-binding protein 1-like isoform X2 [Geotrypetes seraphini]XP_033796303.1 chromodomain-helicase-DNA-binding protein 1-like isoform X2 [Geotrypetes seraphini]
MGLGKTCQTISLLLYLRGSLKHTDPFLILCPLSVLTNWKMELERFSPGLSVMVYIGDKLKRASLQQDMKNKAVFHVLLTTYEICLKDAGWLRNIRNWCVLVVDEAHRLKNQNSLLHKTISEFPVGFRILLTGTPIQNNLEELYSLLNFIEPDVFSRELTSEFVNTYYSLEKDTEKTEELHRLLQPFLLRREKADVALDLPKKMEIVVYHGMSALQKKYYKAILMKDLDAFENDTRKKARLVNVLIQLRKCVDHPYLFDGVEPEPFEIGEHLVEASGKLHLLDKMLAFLYSEGHRVLLFSQMTRMLDILQDYMEYKGYSYERLDGSVRGEERYLAIKSFSNDSVFVFLLSTKAGGVGMNLTAADTVIFVDSDYNPQNDLQAAARAHRIGQNKPVKVIRLIGRDTVEEIIYRRATSKLRLTNTIMEGGQFAFSGEKAQAPAVIQLNEILKFGLDKLLSCEESTIQEVDLKNILGDSRKGEWVTERLQQQDKEDEGADSESHMYIYEGKDYSKEASIEDKKLFDQLLELQRIMLNDAKTEGRALRNKLNFSLTGQLDLPARKRVLSPEELAARQKRQQEAAAKRVRLMEEKKKEKEEKEQKKKQIWWESCGYISSRIASEDSETEEELEEKEEVPATDFDSRDPEQFSINYIIGDITHPRAEDEDAIIVHCVDDSGRWGRGGLFTALEGRSDEPRKIYEMAGKMKDLVLGGVLLFPIDDKESRSQGHDLLALIVAQHRDRFNNLSGIKPVALEEGLKKIYLAAKKKNASIHLPRIGHATKGFNWYGTERLIRKYLASRGVPTFIYYYPRTLVSSSSSQASTAPFSRSHMSPPDCTDSTGKIAGENKDLPSFMTQVNVYFYNIPEMEKKKLNRYLISYNGNVDNSFTTETTHLVAQVDCLRHAQEIQQLLQDNPTSRIVHPRWLEVCFSKQKRIGTKKYQIDLTRHLANTAATCDHP